MVGTINSVIGSELWDVLARVLTQLSHRIKVVWHGHIQFNSMLVYVDEGSGLARDIRRVDRIVDL